MHKKVQTMDIRVKQYLQRTRPDNVRTQLQTILWLASELGMYDFLDVMFDTAQKLEDYAGQIDSCIQDMTKRAKTLKFTDEKRIAGFTEAVDIMLKNFKQLETD